jgi:putative addiction module component (TIGR02574 family)
MSTDLSQFGDLSLPQQLQIVEELWDRIAASNRSLPIPDWHKEELDRRELDGDAPGIPWEEVKRQIRGTDGQ